VHDIAQAARAFDDGAIHDEPSSVHAVTAEERDRLLAAILPMADIAGYRSNDTRPVVDHAIAILRGLVARIGELTLQRDTARVAARLHTVDPPVPYDGTGHADGRAYEIHYAPRR
jgi:hypothetical protein